MHPRPNAFPGLGPTDKKVHNQYMQQTFNQYVAQQSAANDPLRRNSTASQSFGQQNTYMTMVNPQKKQQGFQVPSDGQGHPKSPPHQNNEAMIAAQMSALF